MSDFLINPYVFASFTPRDIMVMLIYWNMRESTGSYMLSDGSGFTPIYVNELF